MSSVKAQRGKKSYPFRMVRDGIEEGPFELPSRIVSISVARDQQQTSHLKGVVVTQVLISERSVLDWRRVSSDCPENKICVEK